ncbi:UTP--glucose-1-phosphate uridylyltransferase, partial [Mesorhizobium sp. M7A.F.Ca.CA.003.01.2.1]
GFIQANIAFALARDDMKGPVFEMLQEFVRSHERQEEAA